MGDGEFEALLGELRNLSKAEGAQRDGWSKALTPRLRKAFGVTDSDSLELVKKKVGWHLNAAIRQLSEPNRLIARYSFNVTDDPKIETMKILTDRQRAVADFIDPRFRDVQKRMSETILPALAKIFAYHPPGPMPGEPSSPAEKESLKAAPTVPAEPKTPNSNEYKKTKKSRNYSTRKLIGTAAGSAIASSLLTWLLLTALGPSANSATNAPNQPASVTSNTNTGGQTQQTQSPSVAATGVSLVFDDLGGGDPIIMVYPGVTNADQDKLQNGTFKAGEAMPALCKKIGRPVSSHPELGERQRTRDEWIRIHGTPGVIQYAPATYSKDPEVLLSKLPQCT